MKQAMSLRDFKGIGKGRKRVERRQNKLVEIGYMILAESTRRPEFHLKQYTLIEKRVEDELRDTEYTQEDLLETIRALAFASRKTCIGLYTGVLASLLAKRGEKTIHLDGEGTEFHGLLRGAKDLEEIIIENFKGEQIAAYLTCGSHGQMAGYARKVRIINCSGSDMLLHAAAGIYDVQSHNIVEYSPGYIGEIQIINSKGSLGQHVSNFVKLLMANFKGEIGIGFRNNAHVRGPESVIALNCQGHAAPHLPLRYTSAHKVILGNVNLGDARVMQEAHPKLVLAYNTPGYEPKEYGKVKWWQKRHFKGQGYDGEEAEQRHLEMTGISFPLMCRIAEEMRTMTAEEIMQRADWIVSLYAK